MKILLNNLTLFKTLRPFNDIGFVPTMGGIHDGHISLIKKSIKYSKKTIVSIFINPKQFNNKNDFKSYPSNIKKDLKILKKIKKIDYVYIPKFKDIYKNNNRPKIKINKSDKILCAKFRKGPYTTGANDNISPLTKFNKAKEWSTNKMGIYSPTMPTGAHMWLMEFGYNSYRVDMSLARAISFAELEWGTRYISSAGGGTLNDVITKGYSWAKQKGFKQYKLS
jgi:hypothetical protein